MLIEFSHTLHQQLPEAQCLCRTTELVVWGVIFKFVKFCLLSRRPSGIMIIMIFSMCKNTSKPLAYSELTGLMLQCWHCVSVWFSVINSYIWYADGCCFATDLKKKSANPSLKKTRVPMIYSRSLQSLVIVENTAWHLTPTLYCFFAVSTQQAVSLPSLSLLCCPALHSTRSSDEELRRQKFRENKRECCPRSFRCGTQSL